MSTLSDLALSLGVSLDDLRSFPRCGWNLNGRETTKRCPCSATRELSLLGCQLKQYPLDPTMLVLAKARETS